MLDHAMERSRRTSNRRRPLHEHIALLRQAAPASTLQVQAQARASEPGSCVAAIRAVLTDIAARDLDTSAGPPLNAFLTLNPSAMEKFRALTEELVKSVSSGR